MTGALLGPAANQDLEWRPASNEGFKVSEGASAIHLPSRQDRVASKQRSTEPYRECLKDS